MKVFFIAVLVAVKFVVVLSECPTIKTKDSWGGQAAKIIQYTVTPVEYVIVHHSVTPTCLTESKCSTLLTSIQNYHMNERDFDDIGYNFMIGGDGRAYEGAGWHKVGTHTKGWNSKSMGIAFLGNFTTSTPNSKQLEAGKKLIQCAVDLGELAEDYKLLGAKSVSNTESPGVKLFREIQNWKGFTTNP